MDQNPVDNQVKVCDTLCTFDAAAKSVSDADNFYCSLPSLSTVYSDSNFGITTDTSDLDSGRYFGTGGNVSMLFDKDITFEHYTEEGDECYQGMEFREGFVGMLAQAKYFMGDILDKYAYAGLLKF